MPKTKNLMLDAVLAWLSEYPEATNKQIAKEVGCTTKYVWAVRKRMAHVPPCPESHVPNAETEEALREAEQLKVARNAMLDELVYITTQGTGRQAPAEGVDAILDERGSRYGPFNTHAEITQRIKMAMARGRNWDTLDFDMKEALEMVAHKIGRILNGDPTYTDNVIDIIGYMQLVLDRMNGEPERGVET